MATPILDETDLMARMREQSEETRGAGVPVAPSEEDPLAASMREQAQYLRQQASVARLRALNTEVETEETKAQAARAGAEADLMASEAEKVKSEVAVRQGEVELRRLETERKVQAMIDQGIPEAAARRALGLVAQGQATPAVNADGTPTTELTRLVETIKAVITLNQQIQTMTREQQAASSGGAGTAVVPSGSPSLADEFKKMRELRTEVSTLARDMGFISREELAALAPPKEEKSGLDVLMVDLKDLTRVPASMAVQVYEAQESAKARLYEIDRRMEVEAKKWNVIGDGIEKIFSVFNFQEIGKALAAGSAPAAAPAASAPQAAPRPQGPAPAGLLKLECGQCHQPTVFATREMILKRSQAACATCGAVWDLQPAADQPAQAPTTSANGANGNGHGPDLSAVADILKGA